MGISSVHLNGNLLCAIDTETTGLIPGYHDIIQIAILPLTPDYRPNTREFPAFNLKLKPRRPENASPEAMRVNRRKIADCINHGMDPDTAVDRLQEWFEKLRLAPNKRIVPLGANYANHDKPFIVDWVGGYLNYNALFRNDDRDVQRAANFINDACDWHSVKIPFPKTKVSYLCSLLSVENMAAHDAMSDCLATAEIYRKLMRWWDHFAPSQAKLAMSKLSTEEEDQADISQTESFPDNKD